MDRFLPTGSPVARCNDIVGSHLVMQNNELGEEREDTSRNVKCDTLTWEQTWRKDRLVHIKAIVIGGAMLVLLELRLEQSPIEREN